MRVLLIFLTGLMACVSTFGFWAPTPIEKLSADSVLVVIGKVTVINANTNTRRAIVTMDILQTLKGSKELGKAIEIDVPFTLNRCVIYDPPNNYVESFTSNEVCAVFLAADPQNPRFVLTMETDGKFKVDWEQQTYWHALMSCDKPKPIKDLEARIPVQAFRSVPGSYGAKPKLTGAR